MPFVGDAWSAGKSNRKHPLTLSLPLCHLSFYRRYCGGLSKMGHGGPDPCGSQPTGPYLYFLAFLFLSLDWTCVLQLRYTSARHSLCELSDTPDTWHSRSVLGIHFGLLLYQVRHTQNPAGQDYRPSFTSYHHQHLSCFLLVFK